MSSKACTDCNKLASRARAVPHQYMVADSDSAHAPIYRCLLCDTQIPRERRGWKRPKLKPYFTSRSVSG